MKALFIKAIFVLGMSLFIQIGFCLVFHLTPFQFKGAMVYFVRLAQASDIHAAEYSNPNLCEVNPHFPSCASPDGRIIAAAQVNGTVTICDAQSGKRITTVYQPHDLAIKRRLKGLVGIQEAPIRGLHVEAVSISPNGKLVATKRTDEPIFIWDVQTGTKICKPEWPPSRRFHVARKYQFSKNSKMLVALVSYYNDKSPGTNRLIVWDIISQKQLLYLRSPKDKMFKMFSISPDSKTLFTLIGPNPSIGCPKCDRKDSIQIWDIRTGTKRVFVEQDKQPQTRK